MEGTKEVLKQLREGQNIMIVSNNQKQLETLFDKLCEAGFCNETMPLFETDYSKRELARELGQCIVDVHTKIKPMDSSIADVKFMLDQTDGKPIDCDLPFVRQLTKKQADYLETVLLEYEQEVHKLNLIGKENSWNGIAVQECSDELIANINETFPKLLAAIEELKNLEDKVGVVWDGTLLSFCWGDLESMLSLVEKASRLQKVPVDWMYQADLDMVYEKALSYRKACSHYRMIREELSKKYELEYLRLDGVKIEQTLLQGIQKLAGILRLPTESEGFLLDNVRHFLMRANRIWDEVELVKCDLEQIKGFFGMEEKVTPIKELVWMDEYEELKSCRNELRESWNAMKEYDPSIWNMSDANTLKEIERNLLICKAVLGEVSPCESWLDERELEWIQVELADCEKHCLAIKRITYELLKEHKEEVFRLPWEELLHRFQNTYQSVLGRLKATYKQDKEMIRRTYLVQPDNCSDEEILQLLTTLCTLQENRKWFQKKRSFLIEHIGGYYHGENTNWGLLKEDMKQFGQIIEYFDTKEEAYQCLIMAKESRESIQKYYEDLVRLKRIFYDNVTDIEMKDSIAYKEIEEIVCSLYQNESTEKADIQDEGVHFNTMGAGQDALLSYLEDDEQTFSRNELEVPNYEEKRSKIEGELSSFLQIDYLSACTIDEVMELLEQVKMVCVEMDECLTAVRTYCKRREHAASLLEGVKQLSKMQTIEAEFEEENMEKKSDFGDLYQGVATDWSYVCDQIMLAKSMRSDVSKYHLSRNNMDILLNVWQSNFPLYEVMDQLSRATLYEKEFHFADSLFEKESSLRTLEIGTLYGKLKNCYDDMAHINEWITYQNVIRKCVQNGLQSFIEAVQKNETEIENVIETFRCTFYGKWLDSVLRKRDGLQHYLVRTIDEIEEVCRLEKDKVDFRKLETEDYLRLVPKWLSRCRKCLLVKGEGIDTPFYQQIVLDEENI